MKQTRHAVTQSAAFSALLRTMGVGTLMTVIGSTLLAVAFAFALDVCAQAAGRIQQGSASAMTASVQAPVAPR